MNDGIRFSELLAYKRGRYPPLEGVVLPLDIADAKNVRGLLLHIFLVVVHFAHMVLGLDRVDFQAVQREIERGPAGNRDRLFAISEEATANAGAIWPTLQAESSRPQLKSVHVSP
jgi:hypothetical protein